MSLEWHILLKVHEPDSKISKRNFWKGDYDEISKGLSAINWEENFAGKTAEEMWNSFKLELLEQIEEHVPLKKERRVKKRNTFPRQLKST